MKRHCSKCNRVTEHKEFFQEKSDRYSNTFWGGVKKYIWETLIIGGNTNMALKKLDEVDRIVSCTDCGSKVIENVGTVFQ